MNENIMPSGTPKKRANDIAARAFHEAADDLEGRKPSPPSSPRRTTGSSAVVTIDTAPKCRACATRPDTPGANSNRIWLSLI
jgi:hypothetical protein